MGFHGNRIEEVSFMTPVKSRRYKKCTVCGTRHSTGTDLCKLCRSSQIVDTLRALKDVTHVEEQEVKLQIGRLPPYPTNAIPGTPEKIAVIRQRETDGYALHHPDDYKLPNCGNPWDWIGLGEL
jgi:RNA polymerase subunit RPABC4/transcription elongation factor Spt4